MRQRVRDILSQGDKLFSDRYPILTLWQTIAENFFVQRASFTRTRFLSEEFASFLISGRPALCHRDLKNAFSAMLRPRAQQWFHAKTDSEEVNEDANAKSWLEMADKTQRRAMYDRRAQFVRATKEGDGDFAAFGNAVITREICDFEHLLYRCWHLRDVVWAESVKKEINRIHFAWEPEAHQIVEMFPKTAADKIKNAENDEKFRKVKCRRFLLPASDYDLPRQTTRDRKYVSVYVDIENETILEEKALRTLPVTIPRWETGGHLLGGDQYGYSPACIYGLPDARMFQQIALTMLEMAQKVTDPPMIAVGEAINGGVNLFAGAITRADADYDERTGEVLRPITLQPEGLRYGAQREEILTKDLADEFFLSKIAFPQITKDMTAYEASKLWEDFIRGSLPLFEPVEVEYNGALCEGTFDDLLHEGAFGSIHDMPQILRGRDVHFQFDTPLSVAAEKALVGAFQQMQQLIVQGAQIDPSIALIVDLDKAERDAIGGSGAPSKWLLTPGAAAMKIQQAQQKAQAAQAAQQVAHGVDMATRVGKAAHAAGQAASSLQDAGIMGGAGGVA